MKAFKYLLLFLLTVSSASLHARGGDDVGNGGFAYKQSVIILKMATKTLEAKIVDSTLKELVDHPERRLILQDTLGYDDLDKLSKRNQSRGGRKLAMNYIVRPATVIVLMPYFDAFAGKTDTELEDASLQVQKNLLHEAAHIWGYKEDAAEKFAIAFLEDALGAETRPTNQIEIKSDFCSCINGKSDILSACDNFCAQKPVTTSPVLYLNTILGADIVFHPKLGNLYNWCSVQLRGNTTTPQCFLSATDGVNEINNIPVTITPGSNSMTANISMLAKDKTYIVKIVEGKTGSNAQSKEFQIRRKSTSSSVTALMKASVNQYTCMQFGGYIDPNGDVIRENYVRKYYYFTGNESPMPLPPTRNGNSLMVCHDEQMYPGNDSILYPRLEMLPTHFAAWDRSDNRFIESSRTGKLIINSELEERLLAEYGIIASLNLFMPINFQTGPISGSLESLGYIMTPFVSASGKSHCPTDSDLNGSDPLLSILSNYIAGGTEGIYFAENEGEIIRDGNNHKTVYGSMLATETMLKNVGFYVENGLKIKASEADLHRKGIFYYWPINTLIDPLSQGSRKLFSVKSTKVLTTDKRMGCIPKGSF